MNRRAGPPAAPGLGAPGAGNDRPSWRRVGVTLGAVVGLGMVALLLRFVLGEPTRPASRPSLPTPALGQQIDGISCGNGQISAYHVHAHLTILVGGRSVLVPMGIGIVPPWRQEYGEIADGRCVYWLHTHDGTGIIHVEAPAPGRFTLGDFFDIWGQPLGPDRVAQYPGPVTTFVDGRPLGADPRTVPLADHAVIVLEEGTPAPPPPFQFPPYLQ
jgi:hypothetical protein